jgi:hypothetical protein
VCVWKGGRGRGKGEREHTDDGPFWHHVVRWVRTDVSEKHVATGSFVARRVRNSRSNAEKMKRTRNYAGLVNILGDGSMGWSE